MKLTYLLTTVMVFTLEVLCCAPDMPYILMVVEGPGIAPAREITVPIFQGCSYIDAARAQSILGDASPLVKAFFPSQDIGFVNPYGQPLSSAGLAKFQHIIATYLGITISPVDLMAMVECTVYAADGQIYHFEPIELGGTFTSSIGVSVKAVGCTLLGNILGESSSY